MLIEVLAGSVDVSSTFTPRKVKATLFDIDLHYLLGKLIEEYGAENLIKDIWAIEQENK